MADFLVFRTFQDLYPSGFVGVGIERALALKVRGEIGDLCR